LTPESLGPRPQRQPPLGRAPTKREYGQKRIERIERRRRNLQRMMLERALTSSRLVGFDSFPWLDS
jgi:hypothetical protein